MFHLTNADFSLPSHLRTISKTGLTTFPISFIRSMVCFAALVCLGYHSNAQGVSINSSGNDPDPSAILDVSSTTQGQLMPRMTSTQRDAIVSPAQGLMIYNLTSKCFEYWENNIWQTLNCAICPSLTEPSSAGHTATETEITWNFNPVAGATGYKWNTFDDYPSATDVGLNLTLIQNGLTCNTLYSLYFWAYNACGSVSPVSVWQQSTSSEFVAAPTAGSHIASTNQIVWNWNSVSGAAGYKWSTQNAYEGATDIGLNTTTTTSGHACNTNLTVYVWAYTECGHSDAVSLSETTLNCAFVCGSSSVSFTYRGNTVNYGTVSHNGECWLDRNLGASQVAVSFNDANAFGDLFQWGRADDGHQSRTSSTTTTLSNSDNPGHDDFILNAVLPQDWRSPQNDNLWQGVNGINNPCPPGWRIPTDAELNTERGSWSSQDYFGAFASPLKLTASGYRYDTNPALVDLYGFYWASEPSPGDNYRRSLVFNSNNAYQSTHPGSFGISVRCILN